MEIFGAAASGFGGFSLILFGALGKNDTFGGFLFDGGAVVGFGEVVNMRKKKAWKIVLSS